MRSTPNLTKSNFFRLGFKLRSLLCINSAFDHLTRDLQFLQIVWQLEPQVFRGFATIWQKQNKAIRNFRFDEGGTRLQVAASHSFQDLL